MTLLTELQKLSISPVHLSECLGVLTRLDKPIKPQRITKEAAEFRSEFE